MQCGFVYSIDSACCILPAGHAGSHIGIDLSPDRNIDGCWRLDGRSRQARSARSTTPAAAPVVVPVGETVVPGNVCGRVAYLLDDFASLLRDCSGDDPQSLERAAECDSLVKLFKEAARYRTVISQ